MYSILFTISLPTKYVFTDEVALRHQPFYVTFVLAFGVHPVVFKVLTSDSAAIYCMQDKHLTPVTSLWPNVLMKEDSFY